VTVTRTEAQRKRKDELVELVMELQEGGERPPFWEIKSLSDDKQFFPTQDPVRDVEVDPHGTALMPEYMRRDPGLLRAVTNGIITEPYQVEEPTPPPALPDIPEDLELTDNRDKEHALQILASNDVGESIASWGADIKAGQMKSADANILKFRIQPILRYVEYVDSETGELTDEMRELVKERLERIALL
jgi:hypothetical protein